MKPRMKKKIASARFHALLRRTRDLRGSDTSAVELMVA
jgi:hypothetical protein